MLISLSLGFQDMLPIIACAIIMGAREEIRGLMTLSNVIGLFTLSK
jgi:hypothetical protein